MRGEIAQAVKHIYQAIDLQEAQTRMREIMKRYEKKASKFCDWLEKSFEEGLTFYRFPRGIRKQIRTVNIVESLNKEIRMRTNVVRVFPNESSCLRLITAVLADKHEEWITRKRYLSMEQ